MQAPAEIHKLLNQQQDASIGKVENERDEYATVYPFYSNRFHFLRKYGTRTGTGWNAP
jgi:hypothetical protein